MSNVDDATNLLKWRKLREKQVKSRALFENAKIEILFHVQMKCQVDN